MAIEKVGFLGLGTMGSRMASVLHQAGVPITVWTNSEGKAGRWAEAHPGSSWAATPRAAATGAGVVVSMVVDGPQVHELYLGADGAVHGAGHDAVFVDCSTIGPSWARRLALELAERGVPFLDAPVSGSAPRAEAGALTIMVGGEQAAFVHAREILALLGDQVVRIGDTGAGQIVKLINQGLAAANVVALAEAIVAGERSGIDVGAVLDVVGGASGSSAQLAAKGPALRQRDFTPLFQLRHLAKDVDLYLQLSAELQVGAGAVRTASAVIDDALALGYAEQDYAAVIAVAGAPDEGPRST